MTISSRSNPRAVGASAGLLTLALMLLATLLAPAIAQAAQPGDLDPSFSVDGKVRTGFRGGFGEAHSVAIDSQGRIVAAGVSSAGNFTLARYTTNGSLDPSFSANGKVTTDFGLGFGANAIAIDSNDRIVAAGQTRSAGGHRFLLDFALARYKPNGSLDRSFGNGGKVSTDFGGSEGATSVAIDSQGRIVAVGQRDSGSRYFTVARYKPTGSLDPSFSGNGWALTGFGLRAHPNSAAIDSRGRIVAAGITQYDSGRTDFALAGYKPDGGLDRSFSGDGKLTTDFGGLEGAYSTTIDSEGRILAAGSATGVREVSGYDFALARYDSDGRLDGSFGTGGRVRTGYGPDTIDQAMSVATDSQGRIVAAGVTQKTSFGQDTALARYNADGTLDPTFGSGGKVRTNFRRYDRAYSVAVDSQDRIVAAGTTLTSSGGQDFTLARYIGYP
jgi:uncharacterized delta-60 repeat protein